MENSKKHPVGCNRPHLEDKDEDMENVSGYYYMHQIRELYLEKLVSLNPDETQYKPIEELIEEYGEYCKQVGRTHTHAKQKNFEHWLKTEI